MYLLITLLISIFYLNVYAVPYPFGCSDSQGYVFNQGVWPPTGPRLIHPQDNFETVFSLDSSRRGRCKSDQIAKLKLIYNEALYLTQISYDFYHSQLNGQAAERHLEKTMFEIFGEAGTGANMLDSSPRSIDSTKALLTMRGLMVSIGLHSSGNLPWRGDPRFTKTRLQCGSTVFDNEELQRDDSGELTQTPYADGHTRYVDPVSKIIVGNSERIQNPGKGMCGKRNAYPGGPWTITPRAVTSDYINMIVICPAFWDEKYDNLPLFSDIQPNPGSDPPQPLLKTTTRSWTFFHEYTHLVGRYIFPNGVRDFEGEWPAILALAKKVDISRISNAETYSMMAMVLYLRQFDWSDGTCQAVVATPIPTPTPAPTP